MNIDNLFEKWASKCLEQNRSEDLSIIQKEARLYFQNDVSTSISPAGDDLFQGGSSDVKISSNKSDINISSSTSNKSISNDLALLISKMEKPLSSKHHYCKVNALNYLVGATDGLKDKIDNRLPLKMMDLLRIFYLEHCSPIQSAEIEIGGAIISGDEFIEDCTTEHVRDAALTCINSLIQMPMLNEDKEESQSKFIDKSIQLRITIAQNAIQRRCASLEDEEDEDMTDYYANTPSDDDFKTLSGLSLLSRSKRSLCFHVLESALKGISLDIGTDQQSLLDSKSIELLAHFSLFASSCLHGESDPRCLMQMLQLIKEIQVIELPIFHNQNTLHNGIKTYFPFLAIFDAIAPYYPVRFTPPPNDPYGITRESLHLALMEAMTYCNNNFITKEIVPNEEENITILVTRLFLERLSPPSSHPYDDDQNEESTVQDRVDALSDMYFLLLPNNLNENVTCHDQQKLQQHIISNLSIGVVKEMSEILLSCHEDAAASAASAASATNDREKEENKNLSDLCRDFVSRMSYEFEVQSRHQDQKHGEKDDVDSPTQSFWDCFVLNKVQSLSTIIASNPQSIKGRVAIAYIASISACGGERTLRLCLNNCVTPLLDILKSNYESPNRDQEQMSIAAYGIGVLFSSSRLSMEQIFKDGIVIHPHPLQDFSGPTVDILCKILDRGDCEMVIDLKVAAVKALESVLISSPSTVMINADTTMIRRTILRLTKCVINEFNLKQMSDEASPDWKLACTRLVGTVVGKALSRKEDPKISGLCLKTTFLDSDAEISLFVEEHLFPKVTESCKAYHDIDDNQTRYDWKVLALACETGEQNVSEMVISQLFDSLKASIQTNACDRKMIKTLATVISQLLQKGGPGPSIAFHHIDQHMDITNVLSNQKAQSEEDAEMSNLLLPEIRNKKRSEAEEAIQIAYSILHLLLPAYHGTPPSKVNNVVSLVSQVLPPLSEYDNTKLCVLLPIMSTILADKVILEKETLDSLRIITPYLIDYSIGKDHNNTVRSAACSCIFSIIAKQLKNDSTCPGLKLLKDIICPSIVRVLTVTEDRTPCKNHVEELQDAINITAVIGSAAACRGRSSCKTADEVSRFLALLACESAVSSAMFGILETLECKWQSHSYVNCGIDITVIAANALGSMWNVESGRPLWRQRIAHVVAPTILSSLTLNFERGRLLCACHLVSCVSISALGKERIGQLTSLIINGFEKSLDAKIKKVESRIDGSHHISTGNLDGIIIASLLKIISVSPESISSHLKIVVPSILLTLISSENTDDVPSCLLGLQILMNIASQPSNQNVTYTFCQSYKRVVLFHLENLLDHSSCQIRQTAMQTRNIWYMLE